MSENSIQGDYIENAAALQAEFEALYIPPNIDPRLLALWIEREQEKIAQQQRKQSPPPPRKCGRTLIRLFPAYIGISIMCFSIILGLIRWQDPAITLKTACIAFLAYTFIGLFVGVIAERCVNDSVETLLRDIVTRSRKLGQEESSSPPP